jgi:hypothetical protein
MKLTGKTALTLVIIIAASSFLSAQDWTFIKEKDGIKIYTRSEEGNPVKSYKGETDLRTGMKELSAVIENVENFKSWDEDINEIRVLASEENIFFRYYLSYSVQWPFDARDLCVEATITQDPVTGKRVVLAVPVENIIPEVPGKVRIKNYWQKWTVEPGVNGLIHLTLEGSVDPGGSIPAWISNMVIVNTPLNIMKNLREQISH